MIRNYLTFEELGSMLFYLGSAHLEIAEILEYSQQTVFVYENFRQHSHMAKVVASYFPLRIQQMLKNPKSFKLPINKDLISELKSNPSKSHEVLRKINSEFYTFYKQMYESYNPLSEGFLGELAAIGCQCFSYLADNQDRGN